MENPTVTKGPTGTPVKVTGVAPGRAACQVAWHLLHTTAQGVCF